MFGDYAEFGIVRKLIQIIAEVQKLQSELDDVEVKSAKQGTPQRLYEPLSAFSNRTGGGVIIFGMDEKRRFEIVGVGNAHRLQEEISHTASAEIEPPLRPKFTVQDFEGKSVVAVEIAEIPANRKPCYYKTAGLPKGTYIRVAFAGVRFGRPPRHASLGILYLNRFCRGARYI